MAKNVTRRNLMQAAAAGAAVAGLAACSSETEEETTDDATEEVEEAEADATDALAAPDTSSYPIDPDGDDVEALWTAEDTGDGYYLVTQGDGTTLGIADTSKLIQVSGYAFKDLNGNGVLDVWEDWRQDTTTRATALAEEMVEADPNLAIRQMNSGSFRTSDDSTETDTGFTSAEQNDLDEGYTNRVKMTFTDAVKTYVPWFNEMQAYAESVNYGIPVCFEGEAFQGMSSMGPGGLLWPSSPTIAASFDMENAREVAKGLSTVLRGYGATKVNSPQSDIGTEPTWDRNSGTFCGDPALGRDMANGFISGCQSHYDENGEDQGWGRTSLLCNMKHFPGDGAAQFGGNSHNRDDRFDIYPNGNFAANWVPFIDGALNLDSKTGQAASAMPFYSIPYTEDEEYGELVGGGFNKYIMSLGRAYGFEGMYSSDWGIIGDWANEGRPWGVENLTIAQRLAKSYEAGMCLMIDDNTYDVCDEALEIMYEDMGEDEAKARLEDSIMRIERTTMNLGLFENPYLDEDESDELTDASAWEDSMQEILMKGIIMLKNDGAISEGCITTDTKVYMPLEFSDSSAGNTFFVSTETEASASLAVDEEVCANYFTVVTDTVPETVESEDDITRLTTDELADVKYAIVYIDSPSSATASDMGEDAEVFYPRTLQYRPFTADDESGCLEYCIAGTDASTTEYENCSPYGNTATTSNESDLDLVIDVKSRLPEDAKLILIVRTSNPVQCYYEIEPYADAILVSNCNEDENYLKVACGQYEPSGLLAWNQPIDMAACFGGSATDTPRDEECYTDSMGNTYEFGFGLNWSGVIDDERTATYKVSPLLEPESTMDESLLVYE